MANSSILAAFERMWQHIAVALNNKSDANHSHGDIYAAKDELTAVSNLVGDTSVSSQISKAIENKSDDDHTHTAEEVGADPVGSAGNALTESKQYTDTKISDLINSAPTTLDTLGEIAEAMAENADVVEALEQAIGLKATVADLTAHKSDKNNPHGVTAGQLGLGNVENKSSATIRSELTKENVANALGYTPPESDTTYQVVTQTEDGLMSSEDKVILDMVNGLVGGVAVSEQISNAVDNLATVAKTGSWNDLLDKPQNLTIEEIDEICAKYVAAKDVMF